MSQRRLKNLTTPALLVAAIIGGWLFTNQAQRSITLGSGAESCFRLEGGARQIECLADIFEDDAADATKGLTGEERDRQLLAFVRESEVLAASDSRVAGLCHPAMHQLGRAEGSRAARADSPPSFPSGSSQLCTAGYVHGLAEGYLTGTADAEVATVFPALCHVTAAREGCAHGVGHALLRARAGEPARSAANAANRRCGDLPGEFPTNCMNGVYMELAMRTRPRPVEPSQYVQTCRSSPDVEESLSCWGYLTLNLNTNDVPTADAPSWCHKADLPGQFTCIEQYGRDLGVDGVDRCASSADLKQLRERCVDGAVGVHVGSGHVSKTEALKACDTIDHTALTKYCSTAVGRYAKGRKLAESSTT